MELLEFINDIITGYIDNVAKYDWPLIILIVNRINMYYYDDADTINTTEDKPNTPKEAQNVLLKVLRTIYVSSDIIREHIFGTYIYHDILQLDPDEIITKYNNYIKSTEFTKGDEICKILDPNVRAWITKIEPYTFECLLPDGSAKIYSKADVKKTGRHNVSLGAILQDNMEGCYIITEEDKK